MGNCTSSKLDQKTLKYCAENSHFTRKEIKNLHKRFVTVTENGTLTKDQFVEIYNIKGGAVDGESIANHIFRAFDLDDNVVIGKHCHKSINPILWRNDNFPNRMHRYFLLLPYTRYFATLIKPLL